LFVHEAEIGVLGKDGSEHARDNVPIFPNGALRAWGTDRNRCRSCEVPALAAVMAG